MGQLELSHDDATVHGDAAHVQRVQLHVGNNEGVNFWMNSTVTLSRIKTFFAHQTTGPGWAPNVNNNNSSNDNSYVGSQGTTTMTPQVNSATGSTGLFFYYVVYGIRDVGDGTSNTIAFSEALVGIPGQYTGTYRGQSVMQVPAVLQANFYDANQNPAAILTALQACNSGFQNGTGGAWICPCAASS